MAKRRILYISPNSLLGGGEINQMLLVHNLDRSRFEAEVAVCEEGPYAGELRRLDVPVTILPMAPLRVRGWTFPSALSLLRLYGHVRTRRPHLLHSSSLPEDHHAALAAWLAGVPVIHDVQTIMRTASPWDRWRAARSAKLVCISDAIQASLARARLPVHRSEVIYSGVDPDLRKQVEGLRIRQELGLGGFDVIGIASRLSPEKGHEYFLKAAALLKDRFPQARFLVVGGPLYAPHGYEDRLKRLAGSLGLDGRALFTGFRRDVLSVMAAMDVLVCAADEEALGRVVLEAMALGKPVIATRAGGPLETVQDGLTGLLVPPRDAASLASAMEKLLVDLDAGRRMGVLGKARVQTYYTIRQNVQHVQRLYDEVLAGSRKEKPNADPDGRKRGVS